MEKYKINGKSISMPSGWADVTYKNAVHVLETNPNSVEVFALFTGMDVKEVEGLNKQDDIYYFLKGFPFLTSLPIEETPAIPRSITYEGERFLFPHVLFDDPYDFGDSEVGQIEDMKRIISDMAKDFIGEEERDITNLEMVKMFPAVVAIYIQPIVSPYNNKDSSSKYHYKRAMKIADELQNELSFKEVVYMGNFFLQKLGSLSLGLKRVSRMRYLILKKWRQAYKTLTAILDSMLP
jgi:hypothetical protein